MLLRVALFALLAVGLAGFGAVAWISTRPPGVAQAMAAPRVAEVKVKVLVASRELRAGNLLKPEDLVAGEMPEAKLPAGAARDTPQERGALVGAMVRRSLQVGEPVLPQDVLRPGDHGFLAAVLAPNMRAITIAVDMVSGSAGLIWPGDRVDLILTQSINSPDLPKGHSLAAETVLSNIRVIAVDQHLIEGATPENGEPKAARTVTLEVTTGQAERVSVAERLGHLSLSVRSADQTMPANATNLPRRGAKDVTWAGDVSPALTFSNPDRSTANTVRVFQGASEGKEFHF